ncbi:MAG: rod shape-determining protein MreC [Balneolaceae bacterium]
MRFRLPRITDAKDFLITAFILIFAVSLMISRHEGGLHNVRKASVTVLSYLEQPLSVIRVYRQALNTNTYLQRQNVLLQDELSRLRSVEQQNRILRDLLNFRESTDYPLIPVTIISKELTSLNNALTVSAGSDNGAETGMPVVNSDGLVGSVILTTGSYSQVMPYTHSLFKISARVQDSRAFGIVSWQGRKYDELVMQHVPQTIAVEPGQIVETSGFSNQYPANIPIGEIIRVEPGEGIETKMIYVRPFVNLHTLAEGFILGFEPDTVIQDLSEQQQELF